VDTTYDTIKEIVEAYNDLVKFVRENDDVSIDETSKSFALKYGSMARTTVDNDFVSQFRSELLSAQSGSSSTVRVFADMGITTNRDGTLAINESTFKSAVGSDATGATDLFRDFADNVSGVDGVLYQFTKYQGYFDIALTAADNRISSLNDKITQLDRQTEKMRQSLELQFARLESTSSKLQSQQAQLTSILGGR
jgi:flagellar hook-associated protein 2